MHWYLYCVDFILTCPVFKNTLHYLLKFYHLFFIISVYNLYKSGDIMRGHNLLGATKLLNVSLTPFGQQMWMKMETSREAPSCSMMPPWLLWPSTYVTKVQESLQIPVSFLPSTDCSFCSPAKFNKSQILRKMILT